MFFSHPIHPIARVDLTKPFCDSIPGCKRRHAWDYLTLVLFFCTIWVCLKLEYSGISFPPVPQANPITHTHAHRHSLMQLTPCMIHCSNFVWRAVINLGPPLTQGWVSRVLVHVRFHSLCAFTASSLVLSTLKNIGKQYQVGAMRCWKKAPVNHTVSSHIFTAGGKISHIRELW